MLLPRLCASALAYVDRSATDDNDAGWDAGAREAGDSLMGDV